MGMCEKAFGGRKRNALIPGQETLANSVFRNQVFSEGQFHRKQTLRLVMQTVCYSCRSAVIGSTSIARRAGM